MFMPVRQNINELHLTAKHAPMFHSSTVHSYHLCIKKCINTICNATVNHKRPPELLEKKT